MKPRSVISLVADIAAVAVAVAILYTLINARSQRAVTRDVPLTVGQALKIPGVKWQESERTLVLFLQPGCRYCTESAPFYRELLKATPSSRRVLGAFRETQREASAYLKQIDVPMTNLVRVSSSQFLVRGTPTAILVNQRGSIEAVWSGKLTAVQEQQLLETFAGKNK